MNYTKQVHPSARSTPEIQKIYAQILYGDTKEVIYMYDTKLKSDTLKETAHENRWNLTKLDSYVDLLYIFHNIDNNCQRTLYTAKSYPWLEGRLLGNPSVFTGSLKGPFEALWPSLKGLLTQFPDLIVIEFSGKDVGLWKAPSNSKSKSSSFCVCWTEARWNAFSASTSRSSTSTFGFVTLMTKIWPISWSVR